MFTDSHCHLASHRYEEDEIPAIIQRADEIGIHRMVSLATSLEDVERNLEIAKDRRVRVALGIHPCDVHNAPDDATDRLAPYVGDQRVCAIGETGLDYFHPAPDGWEEMEFRKRQQEFLRLHFELASQSGLNVVIHTRDKEGSQSFDDALAIYRDYSDRVRAVFHCFISGWELAQKVIDEGGVLSFGGVSTFKKSHDLRTTLGKCPVGSFMLETDSPYLAPEPLRGKRNEPALAMHVAKVVAECRGETLEELAAHTELVVENFFRWEK
ncbi:TatD family hydrolase [Luteolibacter algae]|uniref:TatD family hydrolase n=1 Tax=Luteolibacter algae TaxID=454151 RepID=A0ABW5D8G3_9BACT